MLEHRALDSSGVFSIEFLWLQNYPFACEIENVCTLQMLERCCPIRFDSLSRYAFASQMFICCSRNAIEILAQKFIKLNLPSPIVYVHSHKCQFAWANFEFCFFVHTHFVHIQQKILMNKCLWNVDLTMNDWILWDCKMHSMFGSNTTVLIHTLHICHVI